MKKIVCILTAALCLSLLGGCAQMLPANAMLDTKGAQTAQAASATEGAQAATGVTAEEAKKSALTHAGVAEGDTSRMRVKEDREDGAMVFDVEFTAGDTEYEYEISAATGEVLSMDIDTRKGGSAPQKPVADAKTPPEDNAVKKPGDGSQPAAGTANDIGEDAAKAAALSHAGLAEADVIFGKCSLTNAKNNARYKLKFFAGNAEYEYKIDAATGAVLEYEKDSISGKPGAGHQVDATAYVGEDAAKKAALAYAGCTEEQAERLRMEFDYEKGCAEYEVEWYVGNMEYSCEVDASTGEILSFESEIDD
ncbi:MAG: PepSY domain-containing protein [Clostridia bacterium]|nr:PepSY domain-containing protein [Clostridia bacterium]